MEVVSSKLAWLYNGYVKLFSQADNSGSKHGASLCSTKAALEALSMCLLTGILYTWPLDGAERLEHLQAIRG